MSTTEDAPTRSRFSNAGELPGETLADPSRRSIAIQVFAALAIAWAANWGAGKLLEAYPQNLGYANIRSAWNRLEAQNRAPDWLVLGDSGCAHAIATEVLEDSLGGSAVEVCTLGNMGLLDDAWMLAKMIETVGPPESVLIVHVYDVWQRDVPPVGLLAQVPLPLGYWRRLRPDIGLDGRQTIDVFMARHLPLAGERRSLNSLARAGLKKVYSFDLGARDIDNAEESTRVVRDREHHRAEASGTPFTISPANLEALDRIVELADEHEIKIYIANGPLWDGLAADTAFQRYNRELQNYLTSYARRHSSVYHVDGTPTFGVRSMIRTVDHVRPEAAVTYSGQLAHQVLRLRPDHTAFEEAPPTSPVQ